MEEDDTMKFPKMIGFERIVEYFEEGGMDKSWSVNVFDCESSVFRFDRDLKLKDPCSRYSQRTMFDIQSMGLLSEEKVVCAIDFQSQTLDCKTSICTIDMNSKEDHEDSLEFDEHLFFRDAVYDIEWSKTGFLSLGRHCKCNVVKYDEVNSNLKIVNEFEANGFVCRSDFDLLRDHLYVFSEDVKVYDLEYGRLQSWTNSERSWVYGQVQEDRNLLITLDNNQNVHLFDTRTDLSKDIHNFKSNYECKVLYHTNKHVFLCCGMYGIGIYDDRMFSGLIYGTTSSRDGTSSIQEVSIIGEDIICFVGSKEGIYQTDWRLRNIRNLDEGSRYDCFACFKEKKDFSVLLRWKEDVRERIRFLIGFFDDNDCELLKIYDTFERKFVTQIPKYLLI